MHPTNGKYVTRDNIDKYFLLDQRSRVNIQSKNLTHTKDDIQFHADYYEYPPPTPRFIVQSRIVKECIAEHQRTHVGNRLNKPESAHSNLHSDVMSKEEKIMLINCGTQMSVWKDYNCSETSMTQTTVRGELFRDLRSCDML